MAGNHTGTDELQSRNSMGVNDIHPAVDGVSGDDMTQQRAARVSYHVIYRVTVVIPNKSRAGFTEKKQQQANVSKYSQ